MLEYMLNNQEEKTRQNKLIEQKGAKQPNIE